MKIENMNFNTVDREILRGLLNSKFRTLYFFHENYLLSPTQIVISIKKLTEIDLIEKRGNRIWLKENARGTILKYKNKIFRTNKNENWRKIPVEMLINN